MGNNTLIRCFLFDDASSSGRAEVSMPMERGNYPSKNISVPFVKRDQQDPLERWMLRQKGITLAGGDLAGSLERIRIHTGADRRKGDGLYSVRER